MICLLGMGGGHDALPRVTTLYARNESISLMSKVVGCQTVWRSNSQCDIPNEQYILKDFENASFVLLILTIGILDISAKIFLTRKIQSVCLTSIPKPKRQRQLLPTIQQKQIIGTNQDFLRKLSLLRIK